MPVVSNTSPLLNLAIIDHLSLLQRQFSEVYIPPAVFKELKLDTDFAGVHTIREAIDARWIKVVDLLEIHTAQALMRDLDDGESETIALAVQLGLKTILLDEHDGRAAAKGMGLTSVGILGVLLRAKRMGDVEKIEPIMYALKSEGGFYIAEALFYTILKAAGER
jgi:hypothetical protein